MFCSTHQLVAWRSWRLKMIEAFERLVKICKASLHQDRWQPIPYSSWKNAGQSDTNGKARTSENGIAISFCTWGFCTFELCWTSRLKGKGMEARSKIKANILFQIIGSQDLFGECDEVLHVYKDCLWAQCGKARSARFTREAELEHVWGKTKCWFHRRWRGLLKRANLGHCIGKHWQMWKKATRSHRVLTANGSQESQVQRDELSRPSSCQPQLFDENKFWA